MKHRNFNFFHFSLSPFAKGGLRGISRGVSGGALLTFLLLLPCLLSSTSYAFSPGTTGMDFLKIGPGARPAGMGEAFVAIADDVFSLYWNPAGLVQIKKRELAFMHSFWVQGVNYDYFAYAQKLNGVENEMFGISFTQMHSGDIVRRREDESGNYIGSGNVFSVIDRLIALSYAWEMEMKHSMGITLKFIQSSIDDLSGWSTCVDLGYLFRMNPRLSLGINAQNGFISIPIHYYRGNEAVSAGHTPPINTKIGLAYKCMEDALLLGLALNFPIETRVNYSFGAEYKIDNLASLRLGYKTELVEDIDALAGLSLGFGYRWRGLELDYAFVPYGDLGSVHRISLLGRF